MLDIYRNYQFKVNEKSAMQIRSLHINFTYRIYHITPCTRGDMIYPICEVNMQGANLHRTFFVDLELIISIYIEHDSIIS